MHSNEGPARDLHMAQALITLINRGTRVVSVGHASHCFRENLQRMHTRHLPTLSTLLNEFTRSQKS